MLFRKNIVDLEKLSKVEKELGVLLPDFLVKFYKEEQKLIRKFKRLSKDEDYITLTTDFDWMLEFNRDFLKLPKTEGFMKNKICIGSDGCGNDSFVSLDQTDIRVFKNDHEIADELFDKETNDLDWENERMDKYSSLRAYLEEEIKILKEFGS